MYPWSPRILNGKLDQRPVKGFGEEQSVRNKVPVTSELFPVVRAMHAHAIFGLSKCVPIGLHAHVETKKGNWELTSSMYQVYNYLK